MTFVPKVKKTKSILNSWTKRLISFGKSFTWSLSFFLYPTLSLFISDSICNVINKTFIIFGENKHHYSLGNRLKVVLLCLIYFQDKLVKNNYCCTQWSLVVLKKVGGFSFLLQCNYLPLKLGYQTITFCM